MVKSKVEPEKKQIVRVEITAEFEVDKDLSISDISSITQTAMDELNGYGTAKAIMHVPACTVEIR